MLVNLLLLVMMKDLEVRQKGDVEKHITVEHHGTWGQTLQGAVTCATSGLHQDCTGFVGEAIGSFVVLGRLEMDQCEQLV